MCIFVYLSPLPWALKDGTSMPNGIHPCLLLAQHLQIMFTDVVDDS